MKRLLSTALLLLCAACGGGTTPQLPPQVPAVVDLGLIASTAPTTFAFTVTNTTGGQAAVSEVSSTGVVTVETGDLPRSLAPGEVGSFTVTVTPVGPGSIGELIMAKVFDAQGAITDTTTQVIAEAEAVQLTAGPASLDFGDVLPGTTADATLTLTNTSAASTAQVTAAAFPTADFTLVDTLPVSVPPSGTMDLTVRYTATDPGAPSGDMTLTANSAAGTHDVALQATTGGEEIIDLGNVTFNSTGLSQTMQQIGGTGLSDELSFEVAADAIGFTIEANTSSGSVGLGLLTGPSNTEFENEDLGGAYLWSAGDPFIAQVPSTDQTALQLVSGGGTYKLKLLAFGNTPDCRARLIVERRPATGTGVIGTLDLNVFLANGISVTAATAESDTNLQTILDTVDQIYEPIGIRIGKKSYYDVTNPAYDSVTSGEFGPMLELSSVATDVRLNLFFVQAALPDVSASILGVSPALFGPKINGTRLSGVMSEVGGSAPFIGLVAAHELGHFLGLSHTQERTGTHDNITDTDECPNCTGSGGGYLMHWQAVGGTAMTNGQALVVRAHPHVGPALVPLSTLTQKPRLPPPTITIDDVLAHQDWCATCRDCKHKHK